MAKQRNGKTPSPPETGAAREVRPGEQPLGTPASDQPVRPSVLLRNVDVVPATPPEQLFTLAALRRAWLVIKRAGGGAGADGMTLQKFEANLPQELEALRRQLVSGEYQPRLLRRLLAPKASGGLRPLALWALPDRIAQRVVYDIIAPVFEASFLPCSLGFRPGLGVQDAIDRLQKLRDANLQWVVDADIKDCFDSINTHRLLPLVAERVQDELLLRYIERWLEAKIFNTADGAPQKAGASQGSVLSPLLANIYLHQVDCLLMQQKLAALRYADDLVVCCQRKSDAQHALVAVYDALTQWGLRLHEQKTHIVHFTEGFTWLGHFFVRNECYRI